MIKIREGCFETNSSSQHSIVISKCFDGVIDSSLIPDSNGVLHFGPKYYATEWAHYKDAMNKARYAMLYFRHKPTQLRYIISLLKERTLATSIDAQFLLEGTKEYEDSGLYLYKFDRLPTTKKQLDMFIFNPRSILTTGCDDNTPPPNFYNLPGDVLTWKLYLKDHPEIVQYFKHEPSEFERDIYHTIYGFHLKIVVDLETGEETFYTVYDNQSYRQYGYDKKTEIYSIGNSYSSIDDEELQVKNRCIRLYSRRTNKEIDEATKDIKYDEKEEWDVWWNRKMAVIEPILNNPNNFKEIPFVLEKIDEIADICNDLHNLGSK